MQISSLKLTKTTQLAPIKPWLKTADQCRLWAGDNIRFPFTANSLEDDIEFNHHQHFVFKNGPEIVAFGQLQTVNKYHTHIARLIVNPDYRNQGIATHFLKAITQEIETQNTNLRLLTLNVVETNLAALKIYAAQGFEQYRFVEPDIIQMRRRFLI